MRISPVIFMVRIKKAIREKYDSQQDPSRHCPSPSVFTGPKKQRGREKKNHQSISIEELLSTARVSRVLFIHSVIGNGNGHRHRQPIARNPISIKKLNSTTLSPPQPTAAHPSTCIVEHPLPHPPHQSRFAIPVIQRF